MDHDLIDDDVRRSFPGLSDEQIYEFYLVAKSVESKNSINIFESDFSHARIIHELGWDAFKEYLYATTGNSQLEADDFIALTEAVNYVRELEKVSLYAAIYGAASEASNTKTLSARRKALKKLTSKLDTVEIAKGI